MSAKIARFRSKKDLLNAAQAADLRQGVLDLGDQLEVTEDALNRVVAAIDNRTATQSGWTFVMLSPKQNSEVVNYLNEHSKRPRVATKIWALLFTALRTDTGEICLNRQEIAEAVDIEPRHVSRIMTELVSVNAISRRRVGRGVRYFMNPNVGTHLGGKAREEAQAKAGQVSIFDVIEGGKTQGAE